MEFEEWLKTVKLGPLREFADMPLAKRERAMRAVLNDPDARAQAWESFAIEQTALKAVRRRA